MPGCFLFPPPPPHDFFKGIYPLSVSGPALMEVANQDFEALQGFLKEVHYIFKCMDSLKKQQPEFCLTGQGLGVPHMGCAILIFSRPLTGFHLGGQKGATSPPGYFVPPLNLKY